MTNIPSTEPLDGGLTAVITKVFRRLQAESIQPRLLTVNQAARRLNRKPSRIYELIREVDGLPYIVDGDGPHGTILIPVEGIDEWIRRRTLHVTATSEVSPAEQSRSGTRPTVRERILAIGNDLDLPTTKI